MRSQEEIEAGARAFFLNEHVDPEEFKCMTFDDLTLAERDSYLESAREVLAAADAVAAPAVGVGERSAQKLISDLVSAWDRIPKRVLDSDYEEKWTAYLEARDCMMDALTASSEGGREAGEA